MWTVQHDISFSLIRIQIHKYTYTHKYALYGSITKFQSRQFFIYNFNFFFLLNSLYNNTHQNNKKILVFAHIFFLKEENYEGIFIE